MILCGLLKLGIVVLYANSKAYTHVIYKNMKIIQLLLIVYSIIIKFNNLTVTILIY